MVSRFIRKGLLVVTAARFGWALLPMLLVAAAVFAVASPWGARAIRSLDPLLDARRGVGRSLSVYEPSRMEVVDGVIGMLGLGRRDVLVDIGSGDGRFVVAAARAGASAVGIERQGPLVVRARDNARMAGVASRATFLYADALTLPSVVSQATVVTMFLTPDGLDVLVPWLEGVAAPRDPGRVAYLAGAGLAPVARGSRRGRRRPDLANLPVPRPGGG